MRAFYRGGGKRAFDFLASTIALVLLAPLFILISIVVRVFLGSPVLFRQKRPGQHGAPFTLIKFRTMTHARNAHGDLLPDEERLTAVGRFLRSTSLDELPELWNVLRGDMSLVGPRPLLMRYLNRYTTEQARRHEVRPGLTGWAQVNGRNELSWEEKFQLDLWYIHHYTFKLDLEIIALTILKIARRSGINSTNHATMPEFMGGSPDHDIS